MSKLESGFSIEGCRFGQRHRKRLHGKKTPYLLAATRCTACRKGKGCSPRWKTWRRPVKSALIPKLFPLPAVFCSKITPNRGRVSLSAPCDFDPGGVQLHRDLVSERASCPDLLANGSTFSAWPSLALFTAEPFGAASATLVRSEIAWLSCSTTAAIMCSTKRFASGVKSAYAYFGP